MALSGSGISKDGLKANNLYAILSLLYKQGAMPRKDIAEHVKLTPATVTMLTNEMIQSGLLAEGSEIAEGNHAGRRKVLVDINYRYGYIAGVYLEQSRVIIALSYIDGTLIEKRDADFIEGTSPEELARTVSETVDCMIRENRLDRSQFLFAGVSIVGYVNSERGISENSFGMLKENVNIRELFETAFGVPVAVDNNVRALAIAEIDFNRSGQKINGLFVKHSPGLGGTIIIDNSIFGGAHSHSGELGHFTVDPEGKRCVCGKRGCLQTIVGRSALIEKAANILNPDTTPTLWNLSRGDPGSLSMSMLIKSAESRDMPIYRILDSAATQLAIVIENSMKLIDGDIVITFGELLKNEFFHQKIEQKLSEISGEARAYKFRKSIIDENELWKASIAIATRQLIRLLSQNLNGVKKV